MTFLEAQTLALARVDETMEDIEQDVLKLIKEGLNNAYMLLRSLVDKRTTTATFALDDYDNKLPLPENFIELSMAEHEIVGEISPSDYEMLGDLLHFKSRDLNSGDITLTYIFYPEKLTSDTDILKLKEVYFGALTAYASYMYQLYRKKYSAAQLLLQEFNSYIPSSNQVQQIEQ